MNKPTELLGAGAFRSSRPRPYRDVLLPELGGTVRVQGLTARERGEYEMQFVNKAGKGRPDMLKRGRQLLAVACCVDDKGNRLFSNADIPALDVLPALVLARIEQAARELSGIGDDDFEELVGNSDATPNADSPTD